MVKSRILLVDDNIEFLDSTKDVVEEEGFEVVTATSGEEAIRLIGWQNFDLVIMDIKMPGLNGVESFIAMKRHDPDIRVIMCTAYIVEDLIRQALAEGAYAVLNKPFEISLLLRTIESALKGRDGGRILLADRDPQFASILNEFLAAQGHKVVVAENGLDAVKRAGEQEFDILLLDIKLAGLDGVQAYYRVKAVRPDIAAAIITGYSDEIDAATQLALRREKGLISLKKPLDTVQLVNLLENICEAKQLGAHRKREGERS